MYLTRVAIDTKRRETMRALASPGILHGVVERCFAGERKRRLWRIDALQHGTYVLILSEDAPDCTGIMTQFGYADVPWETKNYDGLVAKIEEGQIWRFRLRANPVHSKSTAKNERGTVYAHVTQEQQKKCFTCTFPFLISFYCLHHRLWISEDEFDVVDTRWEIFKKHHDEKSKLTLRTAAFEGILRVTNKDAFAAALTNGIGKAKAYGCGLMTIMRA